MHATISAKVCAVTWIKALRFSRSETGSAHGCLASRNRILAKGARVSGVLLPAAYTNLMTPSRESEDAEAIVKRHINLLHRYNEAKDATQVWVSIAHIHAYIHNTRVDPDWEGIPSTK